MTLPPYDHLSGHFGDGYLRGGDLENIEQARQALRGSRPTDYVTIECFNKEEVEAYKKYFTADELRRIKFTWLSFKDR